jgi:hypothetical protein
MAAASLEIWDAVASAVGRAAFIGSKRTLYL